MMEKSEEKTRPEHTSTQNGENPNIGSEGDNGLQMAPEQMLDLARQAAELLVERIQSLPEGDSWDGDFQQELALRLHEDPPENGQPAAQVIERVAREVLPFSARLDHPRCFAFVPSSTTWPSVLADFIAAGYNFNACTWLVASGPSQLELVVIDWFRRWVGYPRSAGGLLT
ncbi:MAG: pyridoxal-dependent decarboxylase, partial [Halieaceae bacterium]|nr:pyridoxal-dependent decarboxylase [Halieaceae bacterium]